MLGSIENARIAYGFHIEIDDFTGECLTVLPEGWSFLGEGATRQAFLGPDNVVYKVIHSGSCDDDCNGREYETFFNSNGARGKNWRLAESFLFNVFNTDILAMEYVEGSHLRGHFASWAHDCGKYGGGCYGALMEDIISTIGISDIHGYNLIETEPNEFVLIDYAD